MLFLIRNSVAWVAGYGFTWLAKWCIASVFLRRNVIADALDTILFRTAGNEEYPTNRLGTIRVNLGYMLPKGAVAVLGVLAVCWVGILVLARIRRKSGRPGAGGMGEHVMCVSCADKKEIAAYLPVLLTAVYPFVWYLVLSNHSQIHSYFTYRTLETSIFAVLAFMAVCVRKNAPRRE